MGLGHRIRQWLFSLSDRGYHWTAGLTIVSWVLLFGIASGFGSASLPVPAALLQAPPFAPGGRSPALSRCDTQTIDAQQCRQLVAAELNAIWNEVNGTAKTTRPSRDWARPWQVTTGDDNYIDMRQFLGELCRSGDVDLSVLPRPSREAEMAIRGHANCTTWKKTAMGSLLHRWLDWPATLSLLVMLFAGTIGLIAIIRRFLAGRGTRAALRWMYTSDHP